MNIKVYINVLSVVVTILETVVGLNYTRCDSSGMIA